MHLRQIDIANIVCAVVVKDLPARPVEALDAKFRTRLERFHHGRIWMPASVSLDRGLFRRPLSANLEREMLRFDAQSISASWIASRSIQVCAIETSYKLVSQYQSSQDTRGTSDANVGPWRSTQNSPRPVR